MLKSKRFIALIVSGVIFITGTFFFHQPPIELATGIGIILAPYLAAESFRSSETINTK
jgi:hypothetical protein